MPLPHLSPTNSPTYTLPNESDLLPLEGRGVLEVHMVSAEGEGTGEVDQGSIRQDFGVGCGEVTREACTRGCA